jgi:hypothetical protein
MVEDSAKDMVTYCRLLQKLLLRLLVAWRKDKEGWV